MRKNGVKYEINSTAEIRAFVGNGINSPGQISGNIIRQFFLNLEKKSGISYEQRNDWHNSGKWHFVPNDHCSVLGTLNCIKEVIQRENQLLDKAFPWVDRKIRFIDAGCGVGNILAIAYFLDFDTTGLELHPAYIKVAKNLFSTFRIWPHDGAVPKIIKQDILTYRYWGEYDIVYYYCPLRARLQEEEFEERVEKMVKPGAFIVSGMKKSSVFRNNSKFELVESFKTDKDEFTPHLTILRKK